MKTLGAWIEQLTTLLENSGISTARLDTEVLIADLLHKDRSWVHAHSREHVLDHLTESEIDVLESMIKRRSAHEPLAYIRGRQEFFGREFYVSPDTLTPRPETETMLELLLEELRDKNWKNEEALTIVDIGTGSGCIIITAALELSKLKEHTRFSKSTLSYIGLDISESALKIARKNAKKYHVNVSLTQFDLLKDSLSSFITPQSSTIILANLPYVPKDFRINLAASHEPDFAIYGGTDGLDYYRELFAQLEKKEGSYSVFTESLPPQHEGLANIAKESGFKLQKTQDFIQVFSQV